MLTALEEGVQAGVECREAYSKNQHNKPSSRDARVIFIS